MGGLKKKACVLGDRTRWVVLYLIDGIDQVPIMIFEVFIYYDFVFIFKLTFVPGSGGKSSPNKLCSWAHIFIIEGGHGNLFMLLFTFPSFSFQ